MTLNKKENKELIIRDLKEKFSDLFDLKFNETEFRIKFMNKIEEVFDEAFYIGKKFDAEKEYNEEEFCLETEANILEGEFDIFKMLYQESMNYAEFLEKCSNQFNKRKAINFNLNPGLCKGRVFLSSRGDEEIKESERLQQIYYMLSHDFNKIYIRDKNQYKWNSPHTPREKIKDEMQNRRSCKYVDNRDKYNKLIINNNNCIINNKKEIQRAKDIVLDKVPKMRNMGYQNMASEKVFGLHTEGENKKVNEVNIKI